MSRLLFVLAVSACYELPREEPAPMAEPMLNGKYYVAFTKNAVEGNCDFVKDFNGGKLEFNEDGTMVNPLPGTVDCRVTYPFAADCSGLGATLKATSTYNSSDAGTVLVSAGYGHADGNIFGCRHVGFDFWLGRYEN